jgi:hypothetical protein
MKSFTVFCVLIVFALSATQVLAVSGSTTLVFNQIEAFNNGNTAIKFNHTGGFPSTNNYLTIQGLSSFAEKVR